MRPAKSTLRGARSGAVLVLSIIFMAMFSALAVSMATLSGANVQIASNQHKINCTQAAAESGLEVVKFWLDKVIVSGTTAPEDRFNEVVYSLQEALYNAEITNVQAIYDGSAVMIPTVTLDTTTGQSFWARLVKVDDDTIQVDVTGSYGGTDMGESITRTLRIHYVFTTRANSVFDYGVATKGPLSLAGNIEMEGFNIQVESNAYIESWSDLLALSILGNSHIAGDVNIVNPSAYVDLQGGQAGVGGETGEAAMNHVSIGAPPVGFPDMVPEIFESYATNILGVDVNETADTFVNVRIPAGTNPSFAAQKTIQGVLFIEAPNVVEFAGGVNVTGVIATNGLQDDDSGTNQLIFSGNVDSESVSLLPQESLFDGLHEQTGTFIIAPGFAVSFQGNFGTLTGAIAANGVEFSGNAGGIIEGSVINYSDTNMSLSGNSDLFFNRSGLTEIPAGFVPELVLLYDQTTYSEVFN